MQKAFDLVKNFNGKWYNNYGEFSAQRTKIQKLHHYQSESPDNFAYMFAGCTFEVYASLSFAGGLWKARLSRNSFIAENIKTTNTSWIGEESLDAVKGYQDTIAQDIYQKDVKFTTVARLRFTENCKHIGSMGSSYIARVDGASEFSIHRTYLDQNAFKSSLEPAKAMLCKTKGGCKINRISK